MLIDLVLNHPQALGTVIARTPSWVWGLLGGVLLLAAPQLRDRTANLARVSAMPAAMTAFGAWGLVSGFSASPLLVQVVAAWLGTAAIVTAALAAFASAAPYDAQRREFRLKGSTVPMLLTAGIFLAKWSVGVELAMQPQRVGDASFALAVAVTYGVFNGLFLGRAARLWRLALAPAGRPVLQA